MEIKDLFVPYEQALELEKLGFNEPCLGFYDYYTKGAPLEIYDSNSDYCGHPAPTYSQAFKFFREKYDLIGLVEGGYENNKNIFTYVIWDGFKDNIYYNYFSAYEEAELECLKQLIKIVKDGKTK